MQNTQESPSHETQLNDSVRELWSRDAATGRKLVNTALKYCGVEKISELTDQQKEVLHGEVTEVLSLPF